MSDWRCDECVSNGGATCFLSVNSKVKPTRCTFENIPYNCNWQPNEPVKKSWKEVVPGDTVTVSFPLTIHTIKTDEYGNRHYYDKDGIETGIGYGERVIREIKHEPAPSPKFKVGDVVYYCEIENPYLCHKDEVIDIKLSNGKWSYILHSGWHYIEDRIKSTSEEAFAALEDKNV